MSSSIGRNSLIMASGTAASRVTGLLRTILLAAALGTTGLAANAYQTGAMIPQVIFTVVSGGVFNAVLVPQIVRTMKEEDAEQRLNRLITMSITLMALVTLLMMAATPLLTALYVDSSWNTGQRALVNSFTLWCMPQIFFYGLYTVLGQVLAARNHFGAYAWSSVGANIISCAGFVTFILLFGKANQQPAEFWTNDKVALTAGCWTLGVAFQALVLFVPLARLGVRYRPSWGIRGIGLRSMGPVAAWSLGIMGVQELVNVVNTRIATGAPERAAALYGISTYEVAGNATYQNAYTLYILPYSMIAVSVATAIFPKISAAVARHDLAEARDDLSAALRNTGLLMMFFTVALVVLPVPITLVLLPSAGISEALLISGPLITLSIGLVPVSIYLLIQRTFFAFEDGKHPFIFQAASCIIQILIEVGLTMVLPPEHWVSIVGLSFSLSYLLCFPALIAMLRTRFGGTLDGKRIAITYTKACLAALAAGVIGVIILKAWPLTAPLVAGQQTAISWPQALLVCVVLTLVLCAVYVGVLWLLRTDELLNILNVLRLRFARGHGSAPTTEGQNTPHVQSDSTSPTDTMATTSQPASASVCLGVKGSMKPQLGDTIINRYVLVSPLCEEQGLQVWKATDQVLDQECQIFIVLDSTAMSEADAAASALAMTPEHRCTPILHIHHDQEALIIVTAPDAGVSLSEYLAEGGTLGYDAVRSIIGDTAYTVHHLMECGVTHHAVNAHTVRLTTNGIQVADTPVSMLLESTMQYDGSPEEQAVQQLSALLYQLLAHHEFHTPADLDDLPGDAPYEFRLICARGMRVGEQDMPLASLPEFMMLLDTWTTVPELGDQRITLPSADGTYSIEGATIRTTAPADVIAMPDIVTSHPEPEPEPEAEPEPEPEPAVQEETSSEPTAAASAIAGLAAAGSSFKSLLSKSRDLISEGIDSGHDSTSASSIFGHFPDSNDFNNNRVTMPIDVSSVRTEPVSPFEETSRIPIINADGSVAEPASSQALEQETAVPDGTVPPSFTPSRVIRVEDLDDDVSEQRLFGRFTTKTVAIAAAAVILVAALFLTTHVLSSNSSDPQVTQVRGEAWPEFDPNTVPFGDDGSSEEQTQEEQPAEPTGDENASQDTESEEPKELITDDKQASAMPAPRHVNTTPFKIQSQTFINQPVLNGYGYAVHLTQPQDVYRMVITIRSSGGHGYVRVNTADPNAGEQVADFTFAEGGTTEVMFDKMVNTQDILLWVPFEDLPQNQLYVEQIQFF